MKQVQLVLILTIFLFAKIFAANMQQGEWIKSWLLCGPFPVDKTYKESNEFLHLSGFETDFLKEHGGESNLRVRENQEEKFAGNSLKWFNYSSPDSLIDLDLAISKMDSVIGYAYTKFQMDRQGIYLLTVGSNDGCRVWLNGDLVLDIPEPRGILPDDDLIPVLLKEGENTLLLKIEERGNKWGFCSRILNFNLTEYQENNTLFHVKIKNNSDAVLYSNLSEEMVKMLFSEVELKLYSLRDSTDVIWQGNWKTQKGLPLKVNTGAYDKYNLKIKAILKDGATWSESIPFAAGKRIDYSLFKNKKTNYAIILGEDASDSEKWAANELQYWLKEISGADFPIKSDQEKTSSEEIIVGLNDRSRELTGPEIKMPADNSETYTYKNFGSSILIWGGRERGTMYGVFSFLENELGCRWYSPKVSEIPKKEDFTFDYISHSETPGIQVRNDFYYEAFDPIWAARNKINGAMNYRDQPGGVESYWAVHTFYQFMPPSEFFNDHPEFYSLIDGNRVHERAQLCLTNPDVLAIITNRLRETIQKYPEYLIYSVSQNDWGNPCQCKNCQAIAKREGTESGPLLWFVNQVAENIEKEYPDKYVGTLAYTYTRTSPKNIKPRNNVVIRLCSIECCFAHDFQSCPENQSFLKDLQDWAAISPQLYIWDYVVNFSHYILPYPNFKVLQSNIQTFQRNKAIGIMEQAAYQSRGGEFAELRAYLLAKLLWNPKAKVDDIIDDFVLGYYGRSGQYIRKYFNLLHDQLTEKTHIHLGLRPDDIIFPISFILEADQIFDLAERIANNTQIKERVEMARLPLIYLKLKRFPVQAKYDGSYLKFQEIINREGITHYAEQGESHRKAFHLAVEAAK